ncbi:MAG: hypothetical protein JWL65_2934 [Gammaproteobacteria bacterium]|nr:hypothetical protein [Gammaproteobacteria bacterium]
MLERASPERSNVNPIAPGWKTGNGLMICLVLMLAIAAAYGFGVYLFSALIPQIRADLALSYATIGGWLAARQFGFVVTSLASGALARRFGCARLVLGSFLVICLGLFTLGSTRNVAVLAITLIVINCAAASIWIPMVPLIAAGISQNRQAQALGFIASGTNYGLFANGILIATAVPLLGWHRTFIVTAIVSCLLLLAMALLFRRLGLAADAPAGSAADAQPPAERTLLVELRTTVLQRRYVVLAIVALLGGLGGIPFISYWSSLGVDELKLGRSIVGGAWTTIGVVGMLSGVAMGWFADRFGIRKALAAAIAGLGVAAFMGVMWPNPVGFISASLLFGLTFFPIYGLIPTYIAKTAGRRQAPLLSSVTEGALGVGAICGSALGAAVRTHLGNFMTVYLGIVVVCCLMLILVGFLQAEDAHQVERVEGVT